MYRLFRCTGERGSGRRIKYCLQSRLVYRNRSDSNVKSQREQNSGLKLVTHTLLYDTRRRFSDTGISVLHGRNEKGKDDRPCVLTTVLDPVGRTGGSLRYKSRLFLSRYLPSSGPRVLTLRRHDRNVVVRHENVLTRYV